MTDGAMTNQAPGATRLPNMRVRLRFTKLGKICFTSHRDVARSWERALRRAQLPLAYTEGFSPRPKVHFGLALSVGHESLGEYLDVDLRAGELVAADVAGLPELLTPMLPVGMTVTAAAEIPTGGTSLQEAVTSCDWELTVLGLTSDEVSEGLDRLLAAEHLPVVRERKGKSVTDDIRPLLLALTVADPATSHSAGDAAHASLDAAALGIVVQAELGTQPRGVRPAELLAALDPRAGEGRVVRTTQWIATDDGPVEPLRATVPLVPTERPTSAQRPPPLMVGAT